MDKDTKKRTHLISAIKTPLSFFVLALLIAEAFLAAVLIGADLSEELQKHCINLGIVMMAFVVLVVAVIAICNEESLTGNKK
jgi:hypothetical protein